MEKASIHLNQNRAGKVARGCLCPCFSLQEKKGGAYLSWTGVKRKQVFPLATTYTIKGQGCVLTALWCLCPRD